MNILITGGASGLGEAITRKLANDNTNTVYFTYYNSSSNVKKIESEFQNTKGIKCNFKDLEEVNLLKDKIEQLDLDLLINNVYSGEAIKTYFHKIDSDEFLTEFNQNIIPTVLLTQAAITCFRKKKKGKIISILTSFLLNTPPVGSSIYVANKAYLGSLVKSWATENGKFNIVSNSISPSFMLTNFTRDVDERIIEQMKESHPLKKLLTIDEVAETVSFLSNSSHHVNGIDIPINAGVNIK